MLRYILLVFIVIYLGNNVAGRRKFHLRDQISINSELPALDSFETVIMDLGGTLLRGTNFIDGVKETLNFLRENNKKIIFVTNNSFFLRNYYENLFFMHNISVTAADFVLPSDVIIAHLKDQEFGGKAYAVGSHSFLYNLEDSGLDIITGPEYIAENFGVLRNLFSPDPSVKAVIFEFDPNVNWIKLQQALIYLKQPGVQFFMGSSDDILHFGEYQLLGAHSFVKILTKHSKRHPTQYSKPSHLMTEYIVKKYGILDRSKCLVIGDSFTSDMNFATASGFQKLWVSSGKSAPRFLEYHLRPDYKAKNVAEVVQRWKLNSDLTCSKK